MIKAYLSGVTILKGYSHAEKDRIIKDTTLPNPAYESMKKFARGKMRYSKIPPNIEYFKDEWGSLIVPRGYVPPFPFQIEEDNTVSSPAQYPKLHIKLRNTQREAAEAWEKMLQSHQPHGVIVLPTGKGKSILGLYLARRTGQKALIVVHKDDLVTGWTKDAKLVLGLRPKQVGIVKSGTFRIGEQITIATVQTLAKLDRAQLGLLRKEFGMIIVDEFHHSAAKIYETVSHFPAKYRLGLTATPVRGDGLTNALHLYFGKIAYEYVDLGGDEDIMPVTVKIENVMIDPKIPTTEIKRVREVDEDTGKVIYVEREVDKKIGIHDVRAYSLYDDTYLNQLCNCIIGEYEKGKSCIVFTHERDHIDVIHERLLQTIPEDKVQQYVGGTTTKAAKDLAISRAESKEVLVTIATFHIATEGTNVKAWERAFLASSIANEKDTIQAIGRIRRTKPGKKDAIVYDFRFPLVPKADRHGKVRDKVYAEKMFTVIGKEERKPRKSNRRKTGRGFPKI
ncbi:Type III restriction enzyme, res subunit [compost metagenome]